MAGFVGVCGNGLTVSNDEIDGAIRATVYSSKTEVFNIHSDNFLSLEKSQFNFLDPARSASSQNNISVWVDGEIYNQDELGIGPNEVFADCLLRHYQLGSHDNLLKQVDGLYLALIYDVNRQCLLIITDRYGLKPFYLYPRNNCLIFAPELKCFPHFKKFNLQIRKDVVNSFIDLEHLMGSATWFEGVEVTLPSTVYTYSWKDNVFSKSRYWSWNLIKRSTATLENASEEMAFLLDRAINICALGKSKVGVGLSGGFDSRAILAAIHKDKPITYTFGTEESADVQLAKKVAAEAGVKNIHFDMRVDHWLEKRFSGIHKTDGMLNMYHMHYSHLMDEIPKIMDVNLSGFLGDGVLGSTYLSKKGKTFLNKRIDVATAEHYYGNHYSFSDPNDSFFDIDKVDVYLMYNRGRRLTGLGMEEANKTIHQRLPFMNNKLMDFSYSLPDEFRENSRVYHRALLLKYPEYYKDIPHATTAVNINIDPGLAHISKKLFHRLLWIGKFKLGLATSFADVANWIKVPETQKVIRTILNPKTALYPNFTDTNFIETFFEPHIRGKGNLTKKVMGAITLEIWLQQTMNKKFIHHFEAIP